jgi:ABC-type sugar transport system substrate-binding protein
VANQAAAAYRAHPETRVVFAPYDEFARGAKLAAEEANLASKLRIYSADISTSDIEAIRALLRCAAGEAIARSAPPAQAACARFAVVRLGSCARQDVSHDCLRCYCIDRPS